MPKLITTPVSIESLFYGEDQDLDVLRVISGGVQYETVAANVTAPQVMGAVGAAGDYLHQLICVVTTATAAQVQIKDGTGTAITILPATVGSVGTIVIPVGLKSTVGAWQITTGTGVAVIACGLFS